MLGTVHSSGHATSIHGLFDRPHLRGVEWVGSIHTHPNTPVFSGVDFAASSNGQWECQGSNCFGDLTAAYDQGIDAAMVHKGIVYRWDYQSYSSAVNSSLGYVRAGDFVTSP